MTLGYGKKIIKLFSPHTNWQVCETTFPADDCETVIQIPSQCLLCYFIQHVSFHDEGDDNI